MSRLYSESVTLTEKVQERIALLAIRNDPSRPDIYRDLNGDLSFIDQDGDYLFVDLDGEGVSETDNPTVGQLLVFSDKNLGTDELVAALKSAPIINEPWPLIRANSTGL